MEKFNFNKDWNFNKAGSDEVKKVDLPHDSMLSEKRTADCKSGTSGAFFEGGKYIYTKNFTGMQEWENNRILIQFDGAYRNNEIYLNGEKIGECRYGYIPFQVDISDKLKLDENDELKIIVDNSEYPNSRWYSGSGIYRDVWLMTGHKDGITNEEVKVTTLSYKPAIIEIETDCSENLGVKQEILYKDKVVATAQGRKCQVEIDNAKLWSAEEPNLYVLRTSLLKDEKTIDVTEQNFGIRKIEYSTDGLFINGKKVILKGGCVHHDNGILGAASYKEAEYRKIALLKKWGFNAIRSSHNPINPNLLEACDSLGMYIMDETWDMWYKTKSEYDYGLDFEENYKEDIKKLVKRDFNHPSVIMYSMGNEVTEPYEEKGVDLSKKLVDIVHSLDTTRPVTAGINLTLIMMAKANIDFTGGDQQTKEISSTEFNETMAVMGDRMDMVAAKPEVGKLCEPCLNNFDIAGYNYAISRYENEGENYPDRIIVGTETFPIKVASTYEIIKTHPYIVGDFMWTAIDYLGETGIGTWSYSNECVNNSSKPYPHIVAGTGALDIIGTDTAEAGKTASVYLASNKPLIYVRPVNHQGVEPAKAPWRGTNGVRSWSWNNCNGNDAYVEVFAKGGVVELYLNGKLQGKADVEDNTAVFNIKYEPGVLTAKNIVAGVEVGQDTLCSANGNIGIVIEEEQQYCKEDNDNIIYVDINVADQNKIVESAMDERLEVTVEGGELLAFGSAKPDTEDSYLTGVFETYYGRSIAVIKKTASTTNVIVNSEKYGKVIKCI